MISHVPTVYRVSSPSKQAKIKYEYYYELIHKKLIKKPLSKAIIQ